MAEGKNIAVSLRGAQVRQPSCHYNLRPINNRQQQIQQALELTKDLPIEEMHFRDRELLKKELHERPQLLATSNRFHYVKMALLFGVLREDVRLMDNAEDVLDHISRTQEVAVTVADFLQKLEDSGQCFDVVLKLSNQIIKRNGEQH